MESAVSWKAALEYQHGPTALIFSRQNLQHQARNAQQVANIARGAYILKDSVGTPKTILIATGSEVDLAMQAAAQLGDSVRVVSMPCAEVFCAQNAEYRESVLPAAVRARVAIEAAHPDYWHKFVGLDGRVIGVHRFGESAPANALFKEFGFTVEHVVAVAKAVQG